ncbi:hypothetical protein VaNZ11_000692 [Volvox africanus]|uniref:WW domain-containing protein n=1 Tax=Volvox africanus TaxID=51714 RepID=A0ABQ5RNL6_9CHLO|nr:hypothetical protein VaNZ11_000692 [Volvox africanus]
MTCRLLWVLWFVLAVAFRLLASEVTAQESAKTVQESTTYYYYNEVTGAVQFEDPGSSPHEDESGKRYWLSPSGERLTEEPNRFQWTWFESWSTEQSRQYFFNQATKESRWDRPPDLAWLRLPIPQEDE